ncbi:FadR/GntR family transcriptional regulator [Pseudochelatococcus sp. B33]
MTRINGRIRTVSSEDSISRNSDADAAQPRYRPVTRQLVPDAIASQLQELIAKNSLKAGDRIASERDLALELKVSRSAVREAVKMMVSLGILEVRQGAGTFVCEPQHRPLMDLSQLESAERRRALLQVTEVRRLIDIEAARQAALVATPEDLIKIENYLHASEAEPLRTKRKYNMDLGFEQAIGEATRNPYLIEIQRSAHAMFEAAWKSGGFIPRAAAERNRQHKAIFEAIRSRNADHAAEVMARHFDLGIQPIRA